MTSVLQFLTLMDRPFRYQVIPSHFHSHHAMSYRLLEHRLVCILHLRTQTINDYHYTNRVTIVVQYYFNLLQSRTENFAKQFKQCLSEFFARLSMQTLFSKSKSLSPESECTAINNDTLDTLILKIKQQSKTSFILHNKGDTPAHRHHHSTQKSEEKSSPAKLHRREKATFSRAKETLIGSKATLRRKDFGMDESKMQLCESNFKSSY